MTAVYGYVRRAATELLNEGTYTALGDGSDYPVLNAAVRLRRATPARRRRNDCEDGHSIAWPDVAVCRG